jgi:hypothetical protein
MRLKIEMARTQRDARIVMIKMIDKLGLSHFSIIPVEVFNNMDIVGAKGQEYGTTGIDVRVINSQDLITSVA